MAMEMHVLSDRRLSSTLEWQHAIKAEKFPLRLEPDVQLASLNGFLPARLNSEATGFECFHDDAKKTVKFLGETNFDRSWQFALGLRWRGSSATELQAAWMAAIAYATATRGIVFDHEEGRPFTPDQARGVLHHIIHDLASMDSILERVQEKFSPRK